MSLREFEQQQLEGLSLNSRSNLHSLHDGPRDALKHLPYKSCQKKESGRSSRLPGFGLELNSVVESFLRLPFFFSTMRCGLTLALGRTGFRPGSRGPFLSGKGPKTISTQVGTLNRPDASHGGADQLAGLKQGPLFELSVSPFGRPAGGES